MLGRAGSLIRIVHVDMTLTSSKIKGKVTDLQKFQKLHFLVFLRPRCIADADIIFLPRGFFFLSSFFSPNLSRRTLDVYHTSTHGVH